MNCIKGFRALQLFLSVPVFHHENISKIIVIW